TAREPDGQVQAPPDHSGENSGRRVDRDSSSNASLHEKKECAEKLRLPIESLTEVLIGCVNFQPLIDRYEHGAHNDKRERLPEIILDEPYAALIGLARHRKKRDRPCLRREHGQSDGVPLNPRTPFKILN